MTRRRSYRSYRLASAAWLLPSAGLPSWGWDRLGRPLDIPGANAVWWHAAGLGALILAGFMVIPGVFVSLACFAPDLPKAAVPRPWRASWRNRRDRYGNRKRERLRQKSSYITQRTRQLVWTADKYRCVNCGQQDDLAVDHHVPWAWGGLTILFNLFTLCATCNGRKLDYWEDWRGRPHFSRRFNTANAVFAHRVFRRERRRIWNPFRMLRIAWALGA